VAQQFPGMKLATYSDDLQNLTRDVVELVLQGMGKEIDPSTPDEDRRPSRSVIEVTGLPFSLVRQGGGMGGAGFPSPTLVLVCQ